MIAFVQAEQLLKNIHDVERLTRVLQKESTVVTNECESSKR